jgi:hypothetical protein
MSSRCRVQPSLPIKTWLGYFDVKDHKKRFEELEVPDDVARDDRQKIACMRKKSVSDASGSASTFGLGPIAAEDQVNITP